MARNGVTQQDINAAADALLATGERPTTERVRGALGRGSPNTIAPLLDGWWVDLSQRLAQRLALPDVPDAVSAAFAQAWEAALAAGHAHAETAVAPERAALADVLTKVEGRVADERAAATSAQEQCASALADAHAAHAALAVSDQRVADLQRQGAAIEAQVGDLSARRDALESRLHAALAAADVERRAAASERERLQAHVRQVEDRAYTEVDRLRQEVKALKGELTAQTRESAAALRASDKARREAEAATRRAERETAVLHGRLESAAAAKPRAKASRAPARRKNP